jgi:hypothetical protein
MAASDEVRIGVWILVDADSQDSEVGVVVMKLQ